MYISTAKYYLTSGSQRASRIILNSIVAFCVSFFLTTTFVLYHPSSPGHQRIGWQSWDVLSQHGNGTSNVNGAIPPATANETEWWQLPEQTAGDAPASVSLPLDVWAPMLPHATGMTEIAIKACIVDPSITNLCYPRSTAEEDATKGKWVRVGRDLNKKTGLWYLNVYYRRSRRLDVPLITDIMLLQEDEFDKLPKPHSQWTKAAGQLHDGVYPSQKDLYLWYKLRKPLEGIPEAIEIEDLVTEIDVQYGEANHLLWGFQKANAPVVEKRPGKTEAVWLTYRKGMKPKPTTPPLHFNHNGKFKILQVADLHYSVSEGECLQTNSSFFPSYLTSLVRDPCVGDPISNTVLSRTLELEKPDLVIFTGDQLNGQGTTWDGASVITKVLSQVIDAKVPWTVIFGNHDDQADLNREEQMKIYKSLPYAVDGMEEGPSYVDGVGNYLLKVRSPDPSRTHALSLYFLDSHAYHTSSWSFWKPAEYDWIKPSQIEWYLSTSKMVDPIERPFTPDGAKDLESVWKSKTVRQNSTILAKPNALMFFHIPLPESYSKPDVKDGKTLDIGQRHDEGGSPVYNSGFFEKGILQGKESTAANSPPEVKLVGNGHCHISEDCRRIKGIWLCFGGGSSYSGYGRPWFDRRFRVYEVSDYGETVRTYKRTAHGEIVEDGILVGKGAIGT